MFDDEEPQNKHARTITLGADLSDLSLEDIDDLVTALRGEIERLLQAKENKSGSRDAAEAFFKR